MRQHRNLAPLRVTAPVSKHQAGVGLIEILISLLVLSIGLLGMSALQTRGLAMSSESLQRTQAVILANDIIERARANRQNVDEYAIAFATNDLVCNSTFSIDNATNSVSVNDLNEWQNNLACLLSDGNGQVQVTNNSISVTVTWQDRTEEDADDNALIANRDRLTIAADI